MLGKREPQIYGSQTLADIENHLKKLAAAQDVELESFQANGEEPIINRIHQAFQHTDLLLLTPGIYSHQRGNS
ncbi:3-dehydroquinate dehydratase [Mannheimia haemolytica]|uniref:3-dehydroquinate dehydratase n=1 Tax=Mannheimia haemolytica TaxID=75985 RepID=A0A378MXC1_MANHA|nr:3-dehydroquinate dehydratase [Mannheimia haemolytica]